jgi:hypothetical protein
MVSITDHVRAELDRDGLVKLIGEDGLFEYVSDLLESFQRQPERSPVAAPSASPAPPEPSE